MKGWHRIHAYAECNDCDWNYTDRFKSGGHTHKVGQKARQHHEKTGHRVHAEIGFYKDFPEDD